VWIRSIPGFVSLATAPGEISRSTAAGPLSRCCASKKFADAHLGTASIRSAASPSPAQLMAARSRQWIGTPTIPGGASEACPRKFKQTPSRCSLKPIFPVIPASTRVTSAGPLVGRSLRTTGASASRGLQSQFWLRARAGRPSTSPVRARAVHAGTASRVAISPSTIALRSVRALMSSTSASDRPAPRAMPSISSRMSGKCSPSTGAKSSARSSSRSAGNRLGSDSQSM